jgi:hypothetical protein
MQFKHWACMLDSCMQPCRAGACRPRQMSAFMQSPYPGLPQPTNPAFRYLLVELCWKDRPAEGLSEAVLTQCIRDSLQAATGNMGLGCAMASLQGQWGAGVQECSAPPLWAPHVHVAFDPHLPTCCYSPQYCWPSPASPAVARKPAVPAFTASVFKGCDSTRAMYVNDCCCCIHVTCPRPAPPFLSCSQVLQPLRAPGHSEVRQGGTRTGGPGTAVSKEQAQYLAVGCDQWGAIYSSPVTGPTGPRLELTAAPGHCRCGSP